MDNLNSQEKNVNPISQFKWKRKHYYSFALFNAIVCILLVIDRILASKNVDENKGLLAIVGLPIAGFFLSFYMWKAIKECRDNRSIIKPKNFKYFWFGTSCAITSFLFSFIALVVSWQNIHGENTVKATVFSLFGINIFLGVASLISISIYEFCVCFDFYYHKNKEELVRNLLKSQGNFKIENSKYEDKKEEQ